LTAAARSCSPCPVSPRTYFENREKMNEARARGRKVYEGFVGGLSAVEVYELK